MKKTLLLVDGSSYLYRAYHALPDLRNARGEPTGALYGVISMLRRLLHDYKDVAEYGACVFDAHGGSFRNRIYPQYKANRPPMPDDMRVQIEPIHDAAAALGWTVIVQPEVEADDVIGTLAHQAAKSGFYTIISTGDKDLAQLVDEHVELINTMTNDRLDRDGVMAKFGVPPERIVDYLMLTGDAVDNVPGVDKVGPKTAAKWLAEYGSVESLIGQVDAIKGAAGANLRTAIGHFGLTRELLTIKLDCELPRAYSLPQLQLRAPDRDHLIRIYEDYGFRTWLREETGDGQRLPAQDARVAHDAPPAPVALHYDVILDQETFFVWMEKVRYAPLVALDTETTSLDPMAARLVGLSLAIEPGHAAYIPVGHRAPGTPEQLDRAWVLDQLRSWIEDPAAPKLLHHAKYDAHVFANEGLSLRGIRHDTMLQAYVLQSHRRVNLQDLCIQWLGLTGTTYEDLCGKGARQIGFDEVDLQLAGHYAAEDADFTLRLHQVLYPKLQAEPKLMGIYELEVRTSDVLTRVERNGVAIDTRALAVQSQELGREMIALESQAHALAGQPFNLNSPKQLGEILFDRMQLPVVRKTASGAPSTDEEVLTRLAADYPLPRLLLDYRGIAKLKSTYTDKLPRMVDPRTGRVHTRYAQAAVVTGRLASSDPNLQNIPVRTPEGRRVRSAFVSSLGQVVSADYSQIELRVMAHVSGDENLRRAFAEGQDIHQATAAEVFGLAPDQVDAEHRRAAKAINFGLIYGMGEFGLATNLGITRAAARSYIDRYFMRYPGVADYMVRIRKQAHDQGFVETVFGRRLYFPELAGAKGPRAAAAERAAINAPMQGTAADLIKMAMVAVQDWLDAEGLRSLMVMQVHDELVFDAVQEEVPLLREHVPRLMAGVADLAVPLVAEVGVGRDWGEAH
ncbi:MAG: DNA polymerase I [Castellaniella sp.]|uniref:DNA polymerase I n=1 Tax=Castellaniella sp. TaxID=1955812 RepID=UPI0012023616|nr:DNA polymerase I [Castellaniella sp.]TAN30565.1 MAG: DNA polymerase I [Castellaniella sp.]